MFASKFRKVLKRFSDRTVFVDLFGGSGLLSHITKRERPDATVIYNDHDNYREASGEHQPDERPVFRPPPPRQGTPRHSMLSRDMHGIFLERIRREESTGFVDYLTIRPPRCSPANMPGTSGSSENSTSTTIYA